MQVFNPTQLEVGEAREGDRTLSDFPVGIFVAHTWRFLNTTSAKAIAQTLQALLQNFSVYYSLQGGYTEKLCIVSKYGYYTENFLLSCLKMTRMLIRCALVKDCTESFGTINS